MLKDKNELRDAVRKPLSSAMRAIIKLTQKKMVSYLTVEIRNSDE